MDKYYCEDCRNTFNNPKTTKDYSSLDYDIKVCPHCGNEYYTLNPDFKETN